MTPHASPVLQTIDGGQAPLLTATVAELERMITSRWPAYYPQRSASAAPHVTIRPRLCGYSVIFKVTLTFEDGVERFLVKLRRQGKHGSFALRDLSPELLAITRGEYAEHVKAYTFFGGGAGELAVVRPVDFVESHNAIVVEHAAGEDLSELVKNEDPLATTGLRRAGAWWRLFHHELHAARPRAWDPDILDAGLEARLQRLRKFGVPPKVTEAVRTDIRGCARSVAPAPVPVSLVHGDCKLRHVWATPTGIQVIDFGNTRLADSWVDPAALVVELTMQSLWSWRLDSAPRVESMRTLLHAYFDGPPPPAFALYVVDCLLKKWHRRLRNWSPAPGMATIRQSLRAARLERPVERLYVDRWFGTQIKAWLALAEERPPDWLRRLVA